MKLINELLRRRPILNRERRAVTAKNSVCLLALLLWLPLAHGQEKVVAMDRVSVDFPGCLNAPAEQLLFACHRISMGDGFLVAQRKYWPPTATDNDAFEKLTLYFAAKPKRGQVVDIPSGKAWAFFSSGPSSFPGKHGCYGQAKRGTITVEVVSDSQIVVDVDADFDSKSPLGFASECKAASIHKRYAASYTKFKELTSWIGRNDQRNDAWAESHP